MSESGDEGAVHERLVAELHELGLRPGATAYLGVDLGGIALPRWPLPRSRDAMRLHRERCCRFIYDVLRSVVEEDGTVLAPAFSYDYARRGTPYDHETSPSEVGPFTEWFRNRPGVIRSFHPLFSVCGEGPAAAEILDHAGPSAFGANSPFARLVPLGAVFVSLGVTLEQWLTYAHHLEQLAGVNHAYHKVFNVPARRGGVEQPGPFLAFVRYLGGGIEISLERLEAALREEGVLRESDGEAGFLQTVAAADVERIGLRLLAEDPCAFIEAPVEVHMDFPNTKRQPEGRGRVLRFAPEG